MSPIITACGFFVSNSIFLKSSIRFFSANKKILEIFFSLRKLFAAITGEKISDSWIGKPNFISLFKI